MDSTKLAMFEWSSTGDSLLERARQEFLSAPNERVRALTGQIPAAILSPDNGIMLVFAGSYGAGKSTIIKTLTGRQDIAIGAGITTDQTHTYDWGGVSIVDTPGIHTQLRPDHDDSAYRAITDADLLVFVVTNELFDSQLAGHFRKLAIEQDKAHEMMLVVNKMSRAAMGNSGETQDVIREDIRKVLHPFTPEDLRASFIDAQDALESKIESDEIVAKQLWRRSGMDSFTTSLDGFLREKHLSGRYSTALYKLEHVLQEALAIESIGDHAVDGLEELLLQNRRALVDTKEQILRGAEAQVQLAGAQARSEGRRVAEIIQSPFDQERVSRELQSAQNRVEVITKQLETSIPELITTYMSDLDKRVGTIARSELAKELFPRLVLAIEEVPISPETTSTLRKGSEVSRQLGEFLIRNSFNPEVTTFGGLFKCTQYSGTATHETIKSIGRFFDKSFMPWEAVKWTRAVANLGRVFAVAGTLLTVALQVKEDLDADRREVDLRASRLAVRSGFNEVAEEIEKNYENTTSAYVRSVLTSAIESVDQQLADLRAMQQAQTDLFHSLVVLLEETGALIRTIHSTVGQS